MEANLKPGKYIVAVSGGVDSMVLLDLLRKQDNLELVVAHYDHGIRTDSAKDRQLVQKTAKEFSSQFETEEGHLGANTSEAKAREARYAFLRRVKTKHSATAIVTAHHQDDAVETLIINMLRGTGRRGVLKETDEIKRPLLRTSKKEILKYGAVNNISWHEDKTNQDTKYLRNYVRRVLLPKMKAADPDVVNKLLDSSTLLREMNEEIDTEITKILRNHCQLDKTKIEIPRQWLVMLPNEVGQEVLYECVRILDLRSDVNKKNIKNLLVFTKTAKNNKQMPVSKKITVRTEPSKIVMELV